MAATIVTKNSSTTGAVPTSGDLVQGELAVNVTDTGLYTENASGTVVKLNAPSIDDKNTGATKYVTIASGGNVGIGTNNPSSKLEVIAAAGGTSLLLTDATNSTLSIKHESPGNLLTYETSGTAQQRWVLNGSERMRIDYSGNVGIGTNSPSQKLTVDGRINIISATADADIYGVYVSSGIGTALATAGATSLVMRTNNTERMRIDYSGNLLVGTTSASNSSNTFYRASGVIQTNYSGSTAGQLQIVFANPNGNVGSIATAGTTTTYNTSSDYRLKDNIQPMSGALAKVAALKPCIYKWKVDGSDGEGFIAHELAEIVPQCVTGEKDAVDAEGNPKYQGIDTSFLVATLTAAIQELNAKFEEYKAAHP